MIPYSESHADGELLKLMKDFYNLTRIKICIYDTEGNEICYYPERLTEFCKHLRMDKQTEKKCLDCDRHAFDECKRTMQPRIYTCHAGLTEAITPISVQGIIRGFIVIGQIRENKSAPLVTDGENSRELIQYYNELQIIPRDKIESALHILQACASFEHLKRFVQDLSENIIIKLQKYIDGNLDQNLSVDILCGHLSIPKTALYSLLKTEFDCTPAEFVRSKRLEYSKKLLLETNMKISDIAAKCGIGDYNYYSKLFRKLFHTTPRAYRAANGHGPRHVE